MIQNTVLTLVTIGVYLIGLGWEDEVVMAVAVVAVVVVVTAVVVGSARKFTPLTATSPAEALQAGSYVMPALAP